MLWSQIFPSLGDVDRSLLADGIEADSTVFISLCCLHTPHSGYLSQAYVGCASASACPARGHVSALHCVPNASAVVVAAATGRRALPLWVVPLVPTGLSLHEHRGWE